MADDRMTTVEDAADVLANVLGLAREKAEECDDALDFAGYSLVRREVVDRLLDANRALREEVARLRPVAEAALAFEAESGLTDDERDAPAEAALAAALVRYKEAALD